jgi:hypothetical protein
MLIYRRHVQEVSAVGYILLVCRVELVNALDLFSAKDGGGEGHCYGKEANGVL